MCAGEDKVELFIELRPGAEVSSRGRLRADIEGCMSSLQCPSPSHPAGDVPHARFSTPKQSLGVLVPDGGVTFPLASRDDMSIALRLRFNSVHHNGSAVSLNGSILSTNDDGLRIWHEDDAMFAKLSAGGASVTLNAGPGSVDVGVWHTWTVWYRFYTQNFSLYRDDVLLVSTSDAPYIRELNVTALVLGANGPGSMSFDGDLALATIIKDKNLDLWQAETGVAGFDLLQQDSGADLGRALVMLTHSSIWWDDVDNSLLAWGSRCAAAWGPLSGALPTTASFQPPRVAVIEDLAVTPPVREEVLLDFPADANATLRAGGRSAPPLADFRLGSSGLSVLAVVEPNLTAAPYALQTVVAIGNITDDGPGTSSEFQPVLRLGLFRDEVDDVWVQCTVWPTAEVVNGTSGVFYFSVSGPVPPDAASEIEVACLLDPLLLGPENRKSPNHLRDITLGNWTIDHITAPVMAGQANPYFVPSMTNSTAEDVLTAAAAGSIIHMEDLLGVGTPSVTDEQLRDLQERGWYVPGDGPSLSLIINGDEADVNRKLPKHPADPLMPPFVDSKPNTLSIGSTPSATAPDTAIDFYHGRIAALAVFDRRISEMEYLHLQRIIAAREHHQPPGPRPPAVASSLSCHIDCPTDDPCCGAPFLPPCPSTQPCCRYVCPAADPGCQDACDPGACCGTPVPPCPTEQPCCNHLCDNGFFDCHSNCSPDDICCAADFLVPCPVSDPCCYNPCAPTNPGCHESCSADNRCCGAPFQRPPASPPSPPAPNNTACPSSYPCCTNPCPAGAAGCHAACGVGDPCCGAAETAPCPADAPCCDAPCPADNATCHDSCPASEPCCGALRQLPCLNASELCCHHPCPEGNSTCHDACLADAPCCGAPFVSPCWEEPCCYHPCESGTDCHEACPADDPCCGAPFNASALDERGAECPPDDTCCRNPCPVTMPFCHDACSPEDPCCGWAAPAPCPAEDVCCYSPCPSSQPGCHAGCPADDACCGAPAVLACPTNRTCCHNPCPEEAPDCHASCSPDEPCCGAAFWPPCPREDPCCNYPCDVTDPDCHASCSAEHRCCGAPLVYPDGTTSGPTAPVPSEPPVSGEPLPPIQFPDEADPYSPDTYYEPLDPAFGGDDGDGGEAYYAYSAPSPYAEYYEAYSTEPKEPPPVVAGPTGLVRPQGTFEERASFAAEATVELASCDDAEDVAVAATAFLQDSVEGSRVTLEVSDCIGSTAARRRSLLSAALFLEWAITVPAASASTTALDATQALEQRSAAALQALGFAVTSATATVYSSGQTVTTAEVIDYETGAVFSDDLAPVIVLLGDQLMTLELPIGDGPWEDPGWAAMDNIDGDITERCRARLLNATEDFLDVTRPGQPLVMRYTVSDSSGNAAEPVFRRLRLVSPCTGSERWCVDTQTCSLNGVCSQAAAGLASLSSLFAALALPGSSDSGSDNAVPDDDYAYPYDDDIDGSAGYNGAAAVAGTPDSELLAGFADEPDVYADEDGDTMSGAGAAQVVVEQVQDTAAPVVRVEQRVIPASGVAHSDIVAMVDGVGVRAVRTNWPIGLRFVDPGATAYDVHDGYVKIASVQISDSSGRVASVDTGTPRTEARALWLEYTSVDAAGNAGTGLRQVLIVCPDTETVCFEEDESRPSACSFDGRCIDASIAEALSEQALQGDEFGADEEELAARSAPEIRLRGPAAVTLLAAATATPYTLCPPNAPADLVCDPGVASATDEVEGDLLSIGLVTACGPASYLAAVGLAGCTHVKLDTPGTYLVPFSVTNSEGMMANVARKVTVRSRCPPGEASCAGGSCASVCPEALSPETVQQGDETEDNTPPMIELRPITLGTKVFTTVAMLPYQRNTTFSRCAGNRRPTQQAPCDPGAAAYDEQEGDLSTAVTITPAAVSLEAPLGTRVRLAYRVSDTGIPRRTAVAYRIIEIMSPCTTGQYFCSGECLQVPCSALSAIAADADDAPTSALPPPTVHMTSPMPPDTSFSDPLITNYGAAPAFSLQPCNTSQLPANATTDQTAQLTVAACAAYTTNATGAVVAGTTVSPVASYCDSSTCVACTAAALAQGQCLPGVYVFSYAAPAGEYAWANGSTAMPAARLLAVAVAEVAAFAVQISFPAADASSAADLAAAVSADAALLADVTAEAEARAFAVLNGTSAGNGTGRLLDVSSNGTTVSVVEPAGPGDSYAVALEVGVSFRYVPGLQGYISAWPQGTTNASAAAAGDPGTTSGRRRLMQAGQAASPSRDLPQNQHALAGKPAIQASMQAAFRGTIKPAAAPALRPAAGVRQSDTGHRLLSHVGRSLQQTSLTGLQSLLTELASGADSIAASAAATAASSTSAAGASGSPAGTASSPEAATPEVTPETVLRTAISVSLTRISESLVQSSLQLVEVLLTDLPEMSALMDPATGAELQRFVTIRDAWEAFTGDTMLLLEQRDAAVSGVADSMARLLQQVAELTAGLSAVGRDARIFELASNSHAMNLALNDAAAMRGLSVDLAAVLASDTYGGEYLRAAAELTCMQERRVDTQVYFTLPQQAAGVAVSGGRRRLQQARAKVVGGAVTGANRDGQPLRIRQLFDRSTTLVGGMLLHLQRRPATPLLAAERCTNNTDTLAALREKARTAPLDTRAAVLRWLVPADGANRSATDFRSLMEALQWADVEEICLEAMGERVYQQLQEGTEPFGIAPMVNPASSLYSDEAFRTKHLLFDPHDPQATNPAGLPYAFRPLPFPGFPTGYVLWFDMSLPQAITQHRLQYLKDAGFFSARRAATATLQFAGIDVQRSTVAFARLQLRWDDGGTIMGTVTIVGMPLTTVAASAWEGFMRAVPIVLLAACCLALFVVRCGALLQAALTPPAVPRDVAAVSQASARAAHRRHASAILAAAADFVDVAMLAIALGLLLRYSYHALPQLRLQPDPLFYDAPHRLHTNVFLTRRAALPLGDARQLLEAPVNASDPASEARCPLGPARMDALLDPARNEFSKPGTYCRYALPEDRSEIDELAAQHQQLAAMAELWTAYTTVQAFALGSMLLLYARYWLFQASAGAIPRAVAVFASDGLSITLLVVAFCGFSALALHVLAGPNLPETANLGSAALSLAETFLSGSSALEGRLLNVNYDWPWFTMVLLRALFIFVPLFFIVVLQNFYIQSVIFATERAAALNRGEDGHGEGDEEEGLEPEALWQQRLESLAVMILLAEGVNEADIPRKLDQLRTTFCLADLSSEAAAKCDELLASYYATETDTVPEVAIKAACNRLDDPGEVDAAMPSLKALFQAAVTNALHTVATAHRQEALDWEAIASFARAKFSSGYTPGHVMQLAMHGGADSSIADIDTFVWWEWDAWLHAREASHFEKVTQQLSATARMHQEAHSSLQSAAAAAALLPFQLIAALVVSSVKLVWTLLLAITFMLPAVLRPPLATCVCCVLAYAAYLGQLEPMHAVGVSAALLAFIFLPSLVRVVMARVLADSMPGSIPSTTFAASTMAFSTALHPTASQPLRRFLKGLRSHISTSAALQLAAVATAVAAARRDAPLDVRTGPNHFTGFSLLVAVLVAVPLLDGLQLLLHARAVHSEHVLLDSIATASASPTAAASPAVLLPEAPGTLRAYQTLIAARAQTLEARVGSTILNVVCFGGRVAAAAAAAEGVYSRAAPRALCRMLWLLKQATGVSLVLTVAMGVVFGAPTEQDELLSAQMSVFAAAWAIRACAISLCVSASAFLSMHWVTVWRYGRPHTEAALASLATMAGQESVLHSTLPEAAGAGGDREAGRKLAASADQPQQHAAAGGSQERGADAAGVEGDSAQHSRPTQGAAILYTAACRPLEDWQGCTDRRVMAFFRALRTAALEEVLEEAARNDGTPAAGAVTAPLTNSLERKRQEALLQRSEHEWLGDCSTPAGAQHGGPSGAVALRPDYMLQNAVGRRFVLPARLALASGQDWWMPRSRVDNCVLSDALDFATQSQLWLLSNSPRPNDMYREIHEVAALEQRGAVNSYAMIATAAFESLPTSLLSLSDNLRPDAPLIADALRRLDADCVAAGMEALEALHAAAAAAVEVAAAAAAAPLLAALRRQVRAASAARERENVVHSCEADAELVAELEQRALQRQSMSIGRTLRRVQPEASLVPAAVTEAAQLPRQESQGDSQELRSESYDSDNGEAMSSVSVDSAELVAYESLAAGHSTVLDTMLEFAVVAQNVGHGSGSGTCSGTASEVLDTATRDDVSHGNPSGPACPGQEGLGTVSGTANDAVLAPGTNGVITGHPSAGDEDRAAVVSAHPEDPSSGVENSVKQTCAITVVGVPNTSGITSARTVAVNHAEQQAAAPPQPPTQGLRRIDADSPGPGSTPPSQLPPRLPQLGAHAALAQATARLPPLASPASPSTVTMLGTATRVQLPRLRHGFAEPLAAPAQARIGSGGKAGLATAEDGAGLSADLAAGPKHKTLLDVCNAVGRRAPITQQQHSIDSFVKGVERELADPELAGGFDDDDAGSSGAHSGIDDRTAQDTDCATWPAFVHTLSHLLPQTPSGHAAHRAITSRLHSILAAHTSDARVAELLLRAVLPQQTSHGMAQAVQHAAYMHAVAQRLVRCIRSAYPDAAEMDCFALRQPPAAADAAAGGGSSNSADAATVRPGSLATGWLRSERMALAAQPEAAAAQAGAANGLSHADARTEAREVLTRTLTRRRREQSTSDVLQWGRLQGRVGPAVPMAAIAEEDDEQRWQDGESGAGCEGGLPWGAVRRAGGVQLLGLREGRLGPAEGALQQLAEGGPLAAMLPVLQAMLARCLSAEDIGLGQQQGCSEGLEQLVEATLQAALDAAALDSGPGARAAIERRLQDIPQLRRHLLASAATALLSDAVTGGSAGPAQGVRELQQVASLPRPDRAVLSEWLRAQSCAQEMLSLACGHLCVMRTSLLDLEADLARGAHACEADLTGGSAGSEAADSEGAGVQVREPREQGEGDTYA
eukprot:jgi/Ulvmu1/3675/UM017_0089.1